MNCLHCGEVIAPDDVPALHSLATTHHYECSIRAIAGSVAHQRRACYCYDKSLTGPEEDATLTLRQHARRACTQWHQARGERW